MKRSILIIQSLLLIILCSCNKHQEDIPPSKERELSIPEEVEKELMDIVSRDWKSLSDTLDYFRATMLSKGNIQGAIGYWAGYGIDIKELLCPQTQQSVILPIH